MKTMKRFLKVAWDNYCQAMSLAYYPYFMKNNS